VKYSDRQNGDISLNNQYLSTCGDDTSKLISLRSRSMLVNHSVHYRPLTVDVSRAYIDTGSTRLHGVDQRNARDGFLEIRVYVYVCVCVCACV